MLAVSLAVLAAGAVTASRLTSAFIVQLIFTSSPLITAVISSLTTREPWPPKLWETLGLTLLGSGRSLNAELLSNAACCGVTRRRTPPSTCPFCRSNGGDRQPAVQ